MRVRLGPDDEDVGDRRVGDPHLRAGEAVAAVDLLSPGPHPAGIGAGVGLGQAEAADQLASGQPRQPFALLLFGAVGVDRVHDERRLDAHRRAIAAVDPLDLARHQPVADIIEAGAAIFGRDRRPEQAELAHLGHDLAVEIAPRGTPRSPAAAASPAHRPGRCRGRASPRPTAARRARTDPPSRTCQSPPRPSHSLRKTGQGGIRTHGGLAPTAVFKTAALNHSATCPRCGRSSARRGRSCNPRGEPSIAGSRALWHQDGEREN